ncbi:MAG: peptide chain release factor N(5)-glutamine methyltransferase [Bacteroidales bacterium]|jgi:release factor glutamine methyltransferase|nr:peptide chain release factor N(5)-glutamine methyltransferase [Bacteroidales bacterium]
MKLEDFFKKTTVALCEVADSDGISPGHPGRSYLYSRKEAEALAADILHEIGGYGKYDYVLYPDMEINDDAACRLSVAARRLEKGEPLQYVLGYEYFCGHKFAVAPGVLIPRPETEELVELVFADRSSSGGNKNISVLDLCTGSGCIAWSLAYGLPEARVWGCDISEKALETARMQNVESVQGMIKPLFFECDILSDKAMQVIKEAGEGISGGRGFDVIVSNPPYIFESQKKSMHRNVLDYEPEEALFVSDADPLVFYKKIAGLAAGLLACGGMLYLEINELAGHQIKTLLEEDGFEDCSIIKDLYGKDRIARCRLGRD